jgi:hypothetical protein
MITCTPEGPMEILHTALSRNMNFGDYFFLFLNHENNKILAGEKLLPESKYYFAQAVHNMKKPVSSSPLSNCYQA